MALPNKELLFLDFIDYNKQRYAALEDTETVIRLSELTFEDVEFTEPVINQETGVRTLDITSPLFFIAIDQSFLPGSITDFGVARFAIDQYLTEAEFLQQTEFGLYVIGEQDKPLTYRYILPSDGETIAIGAKDFVVASSHFEIGSDEVTIDEDNQLVKVNSLCVEGEVSYITIEMNVYNGLNEHDGTLSY